MEEVDRIIIETLKHLNCNIDDEITSLKHFDADTVTAAVSTCLETINPQLKLSKKLPASMSARIKFSANLAQHIKELSFKGDMGYQTILYCNEIEVRRVLMFLIERLPKETSNVSEPLEPLGYVPRLVKQIENSVKQTLNQEWLPSSLLPNGIRETENGPFLSIFRSCPIMPVNLIVPENTENVSYIPSIHLQCSKEQLIPSLLFSEADFGKLNNWRQLLTSVSVLTENSPQLLLKTMAHCATEQSEVENQAETDTHNNTEMLVKDLSEKKDLLQKVQVQVNSLEEELLKVQQQREKEQDALKAAQAQAEIKSKTLIVLRNDDNIGKLKNLIEKVENRLDELANQWEEIRTPLIEEYQALKSSASSDSLKSQSEQHKLYNLKKTYKELVKDFNEKTVLEQNLIQRCKELNNRNNRAAYTKRILEIVGNIKKQNKEIEKVLADTKLVQKDINNLTGQIDRSFTLCDELIFYNCKHDDMSRKAYKLLAALQEECNIILQGVSELGQAERELRNLDEQVETEKSKHIRDKLEKVQRDVVEIQKEIELLTQQG